MRKWFGCILVAGVCFALPAPRMTRADDAAQIFGGILGAIISDQTRQQQQQQQQQMQQQRIQQQQQQQQQYQQQSRARQPAAPRPQQPEMSLAERMAVQRALAQAGYYNGVIDGILGGGSRQAIANWQAALGAPATGYLQSGQARNLVDAAPPPAPSWPAPGQAPDGTGSGAAQPGQGGGGMALFPDLALTPAGERPADQPVPDASAAAPAWPDAGSGAVLVGEHQLQAAFLFWALAQHPEQTWEPSFAQNYRYLPLMPDGSPPPPGTKPAELKSLVEAAIALRREQPPRLAILDLPVGAKPQQAPEPGPAGMTRLMLPEFRLGFDEISGVPAITRLKVSDPNGRSDVEIQPVQPFFLEPPTDFRTSWAHAPDSSVSLLLRLEIELSDLAAEPVLTQGRTIGQARATIRRATLLLHDRPIGLRPDPPGPDRILHVWEGGAAAPAPEIARPASAEQIAAIYGVGTQDGRVLAQIARQGTQPGTAPRALLTPDSGSGDSTQPLERLELALKLTAIMDKTPERALDPQLAQVAMQTLLSGRERIELFPMIAGERYGGGSDALNDLTFRRALNEQEPELRRRIASRSPQLPLALRAVIPARLNAYDFDAGGFPLYFEGGQTDWLPNLNLGNDRSLVPAFLRIGEEDAQKLLTYLEQVGGKGNQRIYLVLDFAIVQMRAQPGMQGRIGAAELTQVQSRANVESIALFVDPTAQGRIRDLPVPPELQAGDDPASLMLPDEVYLTSAKSLMGAVATRNPEALAQGLLDSDEISRIPDARRQGIAATWRQELLDMAQDSYWIGARFRTGSYDAARGGFPVEGVEFDAVPYRVDTAPMYPPQIRPQRPEDYSFLPVPDNQAVDVSALRDSNGRLAAIIKVGIKRAMVDKGAKTLFVGPPEEAILAKGNQESLPATAELRVVLTGPDARADKAARPDPLAAMAADPAKPTGAPAALMLDAEGIDLLALSKYPKLYDEDGYRRMLVERLFKERAQAGDAAMGLDWGHFFTDPTREHDAAQLLALLAPFRQWTQARLAMLPGRVLLPVGAHHPVTGCPGLVELGSLPENETGFLRTNAAALLGFAPALDTPPLQLAAERAQPGPDRFWAPGPATGTAPHCGLALGPRDGLPADAGHATLIAVVPSQADLPRGDGGTPDAASFELNLTELELAQMDYLAQVPSGLRAILLLSGPVERVQRYGATGDGSGQASGPGATAGPQVRDVLGMTLGPPLAGFETAARAHLPQAVVFRTSTPGTGLFGHATGFLDPESHEALAAVHSADGQSVLAIMRWLEFNPGNVSMEGIKASLTSKYGPDLTEHGPGQWSWGALPRTEDPGGLCGGASTFLMGDPAELPQMAAASPAPAGTAAPVWLDLGWPATIMSDPPDAGPDVARCGPVITAFATRRGDRLVLKLWLADRKLAGDAQARAAPSKPELAQPKVKF